MSTFLAVVTRVYCAVLGTVFEPYQNLRSPEHLSVASTEAFENATLNVGECDLNTAPRSSGYRKVNSEINGVMCCSYDYCQCKDGTSYDILVTTQTAVGAPRSNFTACSVKNRLCAIAATLVSA